MASAAASAETVSAEATSSAAAGSRKAEIRETPKDAEGSEGPAATKRLVLIDGKSVFYRGYYAMPNLSLPDGTPTGGVYGFAAIATEIVKRLNPTKVVVAWDSKSSVSKRRALYADYKAGRIKPGEDFYAQIPLLKTLVSDLGWNFVEIEDYEADDIIGTLSRQADEIPGFETFIISSDLDMLQIVDENTHMWRILKGFTKIEQINVPELEEKYGILKSQFLDLKALKGDTSDNIPGVPGVGEKTAVKLLNEYGDLDGVYRHLPEIKGALQAKLAAGKDSAYLSKKLAEIMFDAPVSLESLPDFHFDREQTVAGFNKLKFSSLIRKMGEGEVALSANLQRRKNKDAKLGESAGATSKNPNKTGEGSEKPNNASAVFVSGNRGGDDASAVAGSEKPNNASAVAVSDDLIIARDIKAKMHQNSEFAKEILTKKRPFWDLTQAEFLLNPLEKLPVVLGDPKKEYQNQRERYQNFPKLYQVLTELDLPLIPVLYQMEEKGMLLDRAYFEALEQEYTKEAAKLEQEIYQTAGQVFNLNSPMQLSKVLFDDLGLPTKGIKKTARGFSTGAKELEKLKDAHPIVMKISEYREIAKLLSTYVHPFPFLADKNGRLHTTFTQNVTATGRLSSVNPNLQNIPVRTEEGRRIRTGFVAPIGRVLVSADYSQFELRLAAALSRDEDLIADFNSGVDIHKKTAAEAFHVPFDAVTKEQRRAAKVINFGILYGMSAQGLSSATKMSLSTARNFIDNYFELRAPIKRKLEEYLKQAREQGYVETYFGRRRPTPDVKSPNFLVRQAAERAAENMPIQGTEADLMKKAMLLVAAALPKGADLVMQVHDSLIVECDSDLVAEVSEILQTQMETVAPELPVKLVVEITSGKNWGEI